MCQRLIQVAQPPLGIFRPGEQRVEIARHPRRRRSLDQQAQIAPALVGGGAEIIILDIEPADDDRGGGAFGIRQRQLLVVAQQIAAAEARLEPGQPRARLDQRPEERLIRARAEAVDDHRHGHAPACGGDHCVTHLPPVASSA